MEKFYKTFDFIIADNAYEKCSIVIDLDGIKFRVNYLPKAQLNNIFLMLQHLNCDNKHAVKIEDYLAKEDGILSGLLEWIPQEKVIDEYMNLVKVCLLIRDKEIMESFVKTAPKKKDGTLSVKKVQRIAWSGNSVEGQYHEIRTVNESSNVLKIEIRRQSVHHRTLEEYENIPTFTEFLSRYPDFEETINKLIQKIDIKHNDEPLKLTKDSSKSDFRRALFKYNKEYDRIEYQGKRFVCPSEGLLGYALLNMSGFQKYVQSEGGTVESELSDKTDYLVINSDYLEINEFREKICEAIDLGVPVLCINSIKMNNW